MSEKVSTLSIPLFLKQELANNAARWMARMYGERISHHALLFVRVQFV
jgi:hypothetical protein